MVKDIKINIKYYLNTKAKGARKSYGFDDIEYLFPLVVRLNIGRIKGGYNVKSIVGSQVYLSENAFSELFKEGRPTKQVIQKSLRLDQSEKILTKLILENIDGIEYKLKDVIKRFKAERLYLSIELDKLLLDSLNELRSISSIDNDFFIGSENDNGEIELLVDGYGFGKDYIEQSEWRFLKYHSAYLGGLENLSVVFEAAIMLNYYLNKKVLSSSKSIGTLYGFKWEDEDDDILAFINSIDIKEIDKFYSKPHKIAIPGASCFFYHKLGYRVKPELGHRYVDALEHIAVDHFSVKF